MIRIAGIQVPLTYDENLLAEHASERLGLEAGRILHVSLEKRVLDTTDKEDIHYLITILVTISGDENEIIWSIKNKKITRVIESPYIIPKTFINNSLTHRPVVVGCGPSGMFAALILAQAGACPILLERGADIDSRSRSVQSFWQTGVLDTESNVQFGAGGAGTFSDGKLKIGMKDARKIKILQEFVEAGAPPEILYDSKPHIGTDRLHAVVKHITAKIISLGGEVCYGAKVTGILISDKCEQAKSITGVGYIYKGVYLERRTDRLVLAIGHSARDTFAYLSSVGIAMEQKPFAVGVRIEHPQTIINKIQYGKYAGDSRLGAADYKMVVHLPDGRAVYTFCMCPGGSVVASASEAGGIVTNGMSRWKRDGSSANTALLVTVEKSDLQSDDPLAGVEFQRKIETAAFRAGGSDYRAPAQRLEDFLWDRPTTAFGDVRPTYNPGTEFARVESYLPGKIAESLRKGLIEMGEWMPGYTYPDAVLTGAETRSTSPVRMMRGPAYQSTGVVGLYPCGEGAGYAGGIISAAVDGVLVAEQILSGS